MRFIPAFTSIALLVAIALTVLYPYSVCAENNSQKHAAAARYAKNDRRSAVKTKDHNKKELLEADVEQSFERFAKSWMAKLEGINKLNSKNVGIKMSQPDGLYMGKYICYGPECKTSIKKTDSAETPYIGLIHYSEKQILKKGVNMQDALNDPGTTIEETPVTEIFRFSRGRWIY